MGGWGAMAIALQAEPLRVALMNELSVAFARHLNDRPDGMWTETSSETNTGRTQQQRPIHK
jgi:hypothetical protein